MCIRDSYKKVLIEIARVYNEAMNIIHYMHDKYYYCLLYTSRCV